MTHSVVPLCEIEFLKFLWNFLFIPTGNTNSNRNCAANEEYKSCGTACEPSCQNPKPVSDVFFEKFNIVKVKVKRFFLKTLSRQPAQCSVWQDVSARADSIVIARMSVWLHARDPVQVRHIIRYHRKKLKIGVHGLETKAALSSIIPDNVSSVRTTHLYSARWLTGE